MLAEEAWALRARAAPFQPLRRGAQLDGPALPVGHPRRHPAGAEFHDLDAARRRNLPAEPEIGRRGEVIEVGGFDEIDDGAHPSPPVADARS